jgi:HK97 family phage major capsid protein
VSTATLKDMSRDELFDRAAELRKDLTEIPETERTSEDSLRMESILEAAGQVDGLITLMDLEERRAREQLASTRGGVRNHNGDIETRSFGEMLISEDVMRWVEKGDGDREPKFYRSFANEGSLDQLLTRAMGEWATGGPGSGFDPSGAGNLLPVGQPIAPIPRQARLYLRDLIPTMTTTLAKIPYVQELNPTAQEMASAVAEGGQKPNATMNFVGANADPTVLAATLVISKQLFEDAQAVVQYINTRLPYIVKFQEDWEFLNGTGTWPDLLGIKNQPNVGSQSVVNSDTAQTLGNAFAKVELQDGTPTAVVMNPVDAWAMFVNRAAGGSGTFDAGTPFSALPLTVWGVPSYRTRAMALNSALVGDFQLGAMIADREEVNIEMFRERYAELNQILMLCEERVGLLVPRPDLFISTALPSSET